MRLMRWSVLLLGAVLMLATPTQALYEGLEFTNMVTDDADFVGFYDIVSIDAAEPGDDTVVIAFTVADHGTQAPNLCVGVVVTSAACGSLDLFLDNPSGYRAGINGDGSWDSTYETCEQDGNTVYCVVTYSTLGAGVGFTLAAPRAISYYSVAQDYAPGGHYAPDGLVGGTGTDYTLVGCTQIVAWMCDGEAPQVQTVYEDLDAAEVEHGFNNATAGTYVLNFTVEHENATATFAWNATSGTVNATVQDSEGAALAYGPFSGQGSQEEALTGLVPGDWNVTLHYTNFTGTFAFSIGATPSDGGDGGTATQTQTEDSSSTTAAAPQGNETGNETLAAGADGEEAPALPFVLATLTLAAVARWRRR